MSLHSQYLKEIINKDVIELAEGFAVYSFSNDSCYIEEIFVLKEHRATGIASHLADKISDIAKQKGCTKLLGSVIPSAKNATTSLRVLLAYGFELNSSTNNFILMEKVL